MSKCPVGGDIKKFHYFAYFLVTQITAQAKVRKYSAEIAFKDDRKPSLSHLVDTCHWT